jgi:hypothetical protein
VEGEEYKFACWTHYGLFGPTIVQLGKMNSPADCQWYINNAIREALNNVPSANVDTILLYSYTKENHVEQVG